MPFCAQLYYGLGAGKTRDAKVGARRPGNPLGRGQWPDHLQSFWEGKRKDMLIHESLTRAARLYGDFPAVVDGATRLTYQELDDRVTRLAAGLQGLGLASGEHVAILALNSFRYTEVYHGVPRAGMVLAPINTRLSPRETEFILNDGDVKALIVGEAFLPAFEEIRAGLPNLRHLIVLGGGTALPAGGNGGLAVHRYEDLLAGADVSAFRPRAWAQHDMAYLCYTGGTTGLPKGVMLSHRNVVSNALHTVQYAQLCESDVFLHACPMFHAADTWSEVAITAVGGVHVYMERFEPHEAMALVQEHGVTVTLLVPTMINMVLALENLADYDHSTIRRIIFGASPMPVERLTEAVKVFGPVFQHVYGQTETSPFLTATTMRNLNLTSDEKELRRYSSCGQPILGVDVRVVDEQDQPVRPGEVGEIVARGPNVMLGYWKRPEETAKTLVDGWVHTGDLATVDEEEFIYIVDRAKDMIITGAENVYSTEVEDALYRHPAVLEAAVIGIPDETWGEVVKAIVVLRPGQQAEEGEVIAHCHEWIAGYKCPKSVDFMEALPKSGAGKILKSELRKPFWEGQGAAVH